MHASLKQALLEWRSQSLYNQSTDFVFPSERLKGSKPLDLAWVLKKMIQPAFRKIGIKGVGWHTFRHTVGSILAEMGEHQLMIRDYLHHANLHVTNKYLQATTTSKRLAQGKLVDVCQGVCYRQASQLWPTRFTATDRSSQSFGEGGILCLLGRRSLLDPNGPRLFLVSLCKPFKRMAGTTGLEPAASAVTESLANVTYWKSTVLTARS
jgi:hypothetical protein